MLIETARVNDETWNLTFDLPTIPDDRDAVNLYWDWMNFGKNAESPAMTRPSAAAPTLMNMYVGLSSNALMARGIFFKSDIVEEFVESADSEVA